MSDGAFEGYVAKALAPLVDLEDDVAAEVVARWIAEKDYNADLIEERVAELLAAKEGGGN